MTEQWRVIHAFPNYAVSDIGRVKRLTSQTCAKAGSILKQCWRGGRGNHPGYLAVDLCRDGSRSTRSVHVLVAEAFHGLRPDGMVPNHRNGVVSDNRADNIEWGTQSHNVKHAYEIGLSDAKGERNGQAKLTELEIVEMRRLYSGRRGEYAALARRFGVSPRQAADIVQRKAWPHVA